MKNISFQQDDNTSLRELESLAKSTFGFINAIAINNFNNAIIMALDAVPRSANILLSVFSNPLLIKNLSERYVYFCDIDPSTLNIDCSNIEQIIKKEKISVLILSMLTSSDINPICEIAYKYGVKIILESSCMYNIPKIEKRYKDEVILCCLYSPFLGIRHARFDISFVLFNTEIFNKESLEFILASPNRSYIINPSYNISKNLAIPKSGEISAAYAQLESHQSDIQARYKKAALYDMYLNDIKDINIIENDGENMYIIMVGKNRDLLQRMLRKDGIQSKILFVPTNFLSIYKNKYSLKAFDFPNSLKAYQEVLLLPFYAELDNDDIKYTSQKIIDNFAIITGEKNV